MSGHSDAAKEILIKAIEAGYIPKSSASSNGADVALQKNLKYITDAYKEIFKAVNNPME